jgi:hypothetical protein
VHRTGGRWHIACIRFEAARQEIDVAAGVLTSDAVAGLKVLSDEDEDGRQQELERLSDRELLRKASRQT